MKRSISVFIFLIIIAFSLAAGGRKESPAERQGEVIIYTYDSFVSEWGAGPELARLFEEKTGYRVTMISTGDGGQIISRAVTEKANPRADLVIGIDNTMAARAVEAGILEPYEPANAGSIIGRELYLDDGWHLTPFDWSYFAIIWDSLSGIPAPESLEDMTKPVYEKKFILMDPRTSIPGLGFVTWTKAVFGDGNRDYWQRLKPSILTMTPGWDTGYGMFTSGEAPLVISYITSPAVHVEYDNTDRFKALVFPEGHPVTIEGAGILKGAKNPEGAKAFMDFLISEEAQNIIPLTQWMYPVNRSVILPESYRAAPDAGKILHADPDTAIQARNEIMELLAR
ncbi:MAG: thiamine ABC transporter substrate-binding protein [Spirochaetaceae bacterium]|jgi:thiamine transport system substrate-binding protein|nr:thiamine ABC transporter substrate-binding protein [Spirochaetaceae bacterium]